MHVYMQRLSKDNTSNLIYLNTCSLSSLFLARLQHTASSSSPMEVSSVSCSASNRNTFSSSSDSEARLRSPALTCGGWQGAEWDIMTESRSGVSSICDLDLQHKQSFTAHLLYT